MARFFRRNMWSRSVYLCQEYKEEGQPLVSRYTRLLEVGGSDLPASLLEPLGVDFRDPAFWQKGLGEIRGLVERTEELAGELGR